MHTSLFLITIALSFFLQTSFADTVDDPRCADGDISFWPDLQNCKDYLVCYKGSGAFFTCEDGELYDSERLYCVPSDEAKCGTTPAPVTTTTTSPSVCKFNGQLLPYPGDCGKFYECSNGIKIKMDCPAGLWFNVKTNRCDYPANTKCPAN